MKLSADLEVTAQRLPHDFRCRRLLTRRRTGLTFVNLHASSHDVNAVYGEFRSKTISRDTAEVVGVASLAPNTYSFFCTVHPDMFGNLTVVG